MSDPSITYVTTGPWGPGTGAPLSAPMADGNFWEVAQALAQLQAAIPAGGRGIQSIALSGSILSVTGTDGSLLFQGALPLPEVEARGAWTAATSYRAGQIAAYRGVAMMATVDHTAGSDWWAEYRAGRWRIVAGAGCPSPTAVVPAVGSVALEVPVGLALAPGMVVVAASDDGAVRLDATVTGYADGGDGRWWLTLDVSGVTGGSGAAVAGWTVGIAGAKGDKGDKGDRGYQGLPGTDGLWIDDAVVNGLGELVLTMSDGAVVTAGSVVGPAGPTGNSVANWRGLWAAATSYGVDDAAVAPEAYAALGIGAGDAIMCQSAHVSAASFGTDAAAGRWKLAVKTVQGPQGTPGVDGADGADGSNGWTPVIAVVPDGERYVQRVVDWTGGSGTKPASGHYIGSTGAVASASSASNLRGPAGAGASKLSQLSDVIVSGSEPPGWVLRSDGYGTFISEPLPQADPVDEAASTTDIVAKFNWLVTRLRAAGIVAP